MIMGLPRGGTSAAAAIAQGLGVPMHLPGRVDPTPEDIRHRYPAGNLEDIDFRDLVWGMTGIDDLQGCYRQFTRRWRSDMTVAEKEALCYWFEDRAQHADLNRSSVVGVKLPGAVSVALPVCTYLRDVYNVEIVPLFISRSVSEAASSLSAKRGRANDPDCPVAWAQAVQAYNHYHSVKAKMALTAADICCYELFFHQVTQQPIEAASTIARRLNIPFRKEAVEAVDTSLHLAAA